MYAYLEKFSQLPADVREAVSGPEAMKIIEALEREYGVDLAAAVMRVMVGEIPLVDLPKFFIFEFNLDGVRARELKEELEERVFSRAARYLGIEIDRGRPVEELEVPADKPAPATQAQGSTFFFSPEDEEEVRTLAARVATDLKAPDKGEEIEDALHKILLKAKVNLSSEILSDRFINILRTYLKNVRNRIETKEALVKPVPVGGVGLDEAAADAVIAAAEPFLSGLHSAAGLKAPVRFMVPEDQAAPAEKKKTSPGPDGLKASGVRDIGYQFKAPPGLPDAKPAPEPAPDPIPELDLAHELAPPAEAKSSPPAPLDLKKAAAAGPGRIPPPTASAPRPEAKERADRTAAKPGAVEDIFGQEKAKRPPETFTLAGRRPAVPAGKVRMDDVKYVPKLMGPVEELRQIDLVNFRRLSQNPAEAAGKIMEKIGYLEEEHFQKKGEGIRAWRESPLNKLYLAIGQESMARRQAVEEVMKARAAAGSEFLTSEEFDAVMELNKKIRY